MNDIKKRIVQRRKGAQSELPQTKSEGTSEESDKITILVIDDSEKDRYLTTCILGRKYKVYAVENWPQAFPYISRDNIDLVLIDVNMPGIQGDNIAKMFRSTVRGTIKIVLFSAMDKDKLKKKAKEVEADGYIHKTFSKMLITSVCKLLER